MAVIANWREGQAMFNYLESAWLEKENHHHLISEEMKYQIMAQIINTRGSLEMVPSREHLRHLNVMLSCLHFLVTQALIQINHLTTE
jgi:hypothetical protein